MRGRVLWVGFNRLSIILDSLFGIVPLFEHLGRVIIVFGLERLQFYEKKKFFQGFVGLVVF